MNYYNIRSTYSDGRIKSVGSGLAAVTLVLTLPPPLRTAAVVLLQSFLPATTLLSPLRLLCFL